MWTKKWLSKGLGFIWGSKFTCAAGLAVEGMQHFMLWLPGI